MAFFDLEWYQWILIAVVLILSVPLKIKFMKWWSKREQNQKNDVHGKWGDDT